MCFFFLKHLKFKCTFYKLHLKHKKVDKEKIIKEQKGDKNSHENNFTLIASSLLRLEKWKVFITFFVNLWRKFNFGLS